MAKDRLISVTMPVYNGEQYLAEAIESVLAQTHRCIEVIVVDDGSTDRSAEVARRFIPPVKHVYQPNGGTAAARNRGINLAQGGYFAFLDADDIWVPEKLARQMEVLEAHPEVEAVFGHVIMLPDLLYLRRLYANNKGITQRQLTHQYLHVLKASLDRGRKTASAQDGRRDDRE